MAIFKLRSQNRKRQARLTFQAARHSSRFPFVNRIRMRNRSRFDPNFAFFYQEMNELIRECRNRSVETENHSYVPESFSRESQISSFSENETFANRRKTEEKCKSTRLVSLARTGVVPEVRNYANLENDMLESQMYRSENMGIRNRNSPRNEVIGVISRGLSTKGYRRFRANKLFFENEALIHKNRKLPRKTRRSSRREFLDNQRTGNWNPAMFVESSANSLSWKTPKPNAFLNKAASLSRNETSTYIRKSPYFKSGNCYRNVGIITYTTPSEIRENFKSTIPPDLIRVESEATSNLDIVKGFLQLQISSSERTESMDRTRKIYPLPTFTAGRYCYRGNVFTEDKDFTSVGTDRMTKELPGDGCSGNSNPVRHLVGSNSKYFSRPASLLNASLNEDEFSTVRGILECIMQDSPYLTSIINEDNSPMFSGACSSASCEASKADVAIASELHFEDKSCALPTKVEVRREPANDGYMKTLLPSSSAILDLQHSAFSNHASNLADENTYLSIRAENEQLNNYGEGLNALAESVGRRRRLNETPTWLKSKEMIQKLLDQASNESSLVKRASESEKRHAVEFESSVDPSLPHDSMVDHEIQSMGTTVRQDAMGDRTSGFSKDKQEKRNLRMRRRNLIYLLP